VTLDFLESLDRFLAYFVNPTGRPPSQFGMVFRFPGACRSTQRLSLTIQLNFAFGEFNQECGALPVADDLIDFRDDLGRIRNHDSLAWHDLTD
jgi:hypothetical protein